MQFGILTPCAQPGVISKQAFISSMSLIKEIYAPILEYEHLQDGINQFDCMLL